MRACISSKLRMRRPTSKGIAAARSPEVRTVLVTTAPLPEPWREEGTARMLPGKAIRDGASAAARACTQEMANTIDRTNRRQKPFIRGIRYYTTERGL